MLFCAGHTLMPDGRLMVSGGHKADDTGINRTNFFTQDGGWQPAAPMAHGRWYPTVTVLPDGKVLTMAGRDETGNIVTTPELWEGDHWVELPGAGTDTVPYYPRNFVAPDGRVFMAGERIKSRWFNVDGIGVNGGRGQWVDGPSHVVKINRDYGTAVMYEPGKILYAGGGGNPGWKAQSPDPSGNAPTATAEKIDLNQVGAQWQLLPQPMSAPRRHLNSTILPDGEVLITGGTRGGGFVDINPANAVKQAEVWNPKTEQWTTLASASTMRVYHSVSMLLPDGTVLHGASGDAETIVGGGIVNVPPERNHEIFSPPYLFKGARPTITSVPAAVTYNQSFNVETPNTLQITEVRWIRLGSVTHAFDAGQRANTLNFRQTATGLEVTSPDRASLAPPGFYLLFILNRNGVPSVGKVIKVGP
jgi:galactose oxidase